jgi:tetratricopeptide (TPR) repeat protein
MSEWHPDRDQLLGFLGDELPEGESREIQRHLLLCADCEERMLTLLPALREGCFPGAQAQAQVPVDADREPEYQGLLKRVLDGNRTEMEKRGSRLSRERAEAGLLLAEVASYPAESRLLLVQGDPRFHSWGLLELVVERARQEALEEPRAAEATLQVAAEISLHLDARRHGRGSVEAAQARVWAWRGNALRLMFDFQGAEAAFARAEALLDRSWLDPLDEALVLELKALLRRAQRRFPEALAMLDEAVALYREVNEPHFQGRTLIAKGLTLQYSGASDGAVACFREALFLVEPAQEPRLVLIAHGNLILSLSDGGRYAEARALLTDVRPLWQELGTPGDFRRLRWIEGRVASGLDRLDEAEAAFVEVRTAFLQSEAAYDAALVSLDLAAVYARQGRLADTRNLAAELVPIFRSREVHREALAALVFFQRAAEMEQATAAVIAQVSRFLESSRTNPGLRFRAGAGEDAGEASPPALAS